MKVYVDNLVASLPPSTPVYLPQKDLSASNMISDRRLGVRKASELCGCFLVFESAVPALPLSFKAGHGS
jgi:hypothetical protein